jgi:hypothetical protein
MVSPIDIGRRRPLETKPHQLADEKFLLGIAPSPCDQTLVGS